jgi:hypothetical protein
VAGSDSSVLEPAGPSAGGGQPLAAKSSQLLLSASRTYPGKEPRVFDCARSRAACLLGLGACRLHHRNRLFHTTDPLGRMNCGSVARMASTIAPRPEWRGLAAAAKQAGTYVARQIRERVAGGPPLPGFEYRHRGSLATIGCKAAVADFGFVKLWGEPAWWPVGYGARKLSSRNEKPHSNTD